jgi:hypothetical protein
MDSEDYCEKTMGLLKELAPKQVETIRKIFTASDDSSSPSISLEELGKLVLALGGNQEHEFLEGKWCFSLPLANEEPFIVIVRSRFINANTKVVKDFRFGLERFGIYGKCLYL